MNMRDQDKTKDKLIRELVELRQRVATLEASVAEHKRIEAAMRQERDFAESLIETARVIVLVLDTAGRIVRFNPYMEEVSGYRLPEVQGRDWFATFLPECDRDRIRALFLQAIADIQTQGSVNPIVTKDGRQCEIEWYDTALKDAEGNITGLLAVGQDITEHKRAEDELKRYRDHLEELAAERTAELTTANEQLQGEIIERKRAEEAFQHYAKRLQILREIDQAVLAAQSPEAIAQAALSHIRHLVPCQRAGVFVFDFDLREVRALTTRANGQTGSEMDSHFSFEEYGSSETLKQGQIRVVEDILALPNPSPVDRMLHAEGIRSYIVVPLIVQSELIGSLNLGTNTLGAFTADHMEIAKEVASSLAVAIQQARLHEQTQQDAQTKAGLLHEVNHRVKNNLAAIIGLLYIEQSHTGVENQAVYQAIMADLINRIEGLATVHHLLSAAEWSPLPLSELTSRVIHSALQALPPDKRVFTGVSPSPVRVTPKQANSLALVINELATNTVKYALSDRNTARITVRITLEDDTILFEFGDDGLGFPEEVLRLEHQNVGMYLIHNIVCRDLDGAVTLRNDNGAVATIRFKAIA